MSARDLFKLETLTANVEQFQNRPGLTAQEREHVGMAKNYLLQAIRIAEADRAEKGAPYGS